VSNGKDSIRNDSPQEILRYQGFIRETWSRLSRPLPPGDGHRHRAHNTTVPRVAVPAASPALPENSEAYPLYRKVTIRESTTTPSTVSVQPIVRSPCPSVPKGEVFTKSPKFAMLALLDASTTK